MLLDSTVLIDLINHLPAAIKKMQALEEKNEPLATTAVCVVEVLQGIKSAATQKEQRALETLREFTVHPLDWEAAVQAGKIARSLYEKGEPIDIEDCMIAGIAKMHNQKILTRNTRHFSRILGIQTESY